MMEIRLHDIVDWFGKSDELYLREWIDASTTCKLTLGRKNVSINLSRGIARESSVIPGVVNISDAGIQNCLCLAVGLQHD